MMGKHGAGRPAPAAAGETRRDTRTAAKIERTEAAKPQMERKPFENGR